MLNTKKATPPKADRTANEGPVDIGMTIQTGGLDYLEQTVKRMVEELKRRGFLSEKFVFLTRAEQEAASEEHIDRFLKAP
mgnify:CR=1 FL=1